MHGVLFLDELPEFNRSVLEVLRQPLEAGRVTVSRAARQAEFPAEFQLVAAMNPCPCGYLGHYSGKCRCTPDQVARYRGRISGPLFDRIDLQIEVPAVADKDLVRAAGGEPSAVVRARVDAAYGRQRERQGKPNSKLSTREIDETCMPDAAGASAAQAGDQPAWVIGARLPSRIEGGAHYRRSRAVSARSQVPISRKRFSFGASTAMLKAGAHCASIIGG